MIAVSLRIKVDTTRTLRRFDALGGATALFFLTENNALATVNKVESKMLYALFDQGNLDKVYYFDNAKNDAYPVVQLPAEERYMKGFRWEPKRQPRGRLDITPLEPRKSQRTSYLARPHAEFKETEVYFPGHINQIYKDIAYRDSMEVVKARQPKEKPAPTPPADSTTAAPADTTLAPPGLLPADEALRQELDSLAAKPALDLPATRRTEEEVPEKEDLPEEDPEENPEEDPEEETQPDETLETTPPQKEEPAVEPPSQKELERAAKEAEKARKAEEKARIAAERQAAKEAKWAEEDLKLREKQAAKEQKRLEKERKKKLRTLKKLEKKAQKERRIFERYLEQERKRAERKAEKEAEKEEQTQTNP